MKAAKYLDAAKKRLQVESDYALAKALGVGKQMVSKWRSGQAAPDAIACHKIATAAGYDPVLVIADIGSQTERDEKRANYWREIVKNYGHAAVWILAIGVVAFDTLFFSSSSQAQTLCGFAGLCFDPVYIMRRYVSSVIVRTAVSVAVKIKPVALRLQVETG